MDRRFFLALLLTGAVVVLTPVLFPRPRQPVPTTSAVPGTFTGAAATTSPAPVMSASTSQSRRDQAVAPEAVAETLSLSNELATYRFSTRGGALLAATLPRYERLGAHEGAVELGGDAAPLIRHRLIAGGDTLALETVPFRATRDEVDGRPRLRLDATVGTGRVSIVYHLARANYMTDVTVQAEGIPMPAFLLTDLPTGFISQEADTADDQRHLAYASRTIVGGAERIDFRKPDPGERILRPGPLTWAVAKSKYFLVGMLAHDSTASPLAELQVSGAPRVNKVARYASGTVVSPLGAEGVSYAIYAGPQEWERLVALGRDFENTNPYGGWISGIVQPFATIVMRILLWMKRTLGIEYGWILVIFGVTIRLAMWPLNSRMMRSSIQMQRVAPLVQAAQAKHATDRAKQQEAVMKVYQEAGVSPFAALSGCLPMLLPMPILFALFFVFQNTIEFRGVSFLWLPDISIRDPLYVLPLAMGASMYLLSWIGMRNVPPNPQTKMMSIMMPVMMMVLLFNFASGLNLYYAVQNLAALPQQWLISNERAKAQVTAVVDASSSGRKKR